MSVSSELQVLSRPEDHIKVLPGSEPRLEVQKVSTFLGFDGVYIIGKVTSGVVAPNMKGTIQTGKKFSISEIESKYPNCAVGKQGMTIGISAHGVSKDEILQGSTIIFHNA
jgi:translation elongation factor EF-1alpha